MQPDEPLTLQRVAADESASDTLFSQGYELGVCDLAFEGSSLLQPGTYRLATRTQPNCGRTHHFEAMLALLPERGTALLVGTGCSVAWATERPVPPSDRLGAPVPEDLEAIVLSLRAKSSDDRPASAAELERRLAACADADAWTLEQARTWCKTRAPEIAKSSLEIASSVLSIAR